MKAKIYAKEGHWADAREALKHYQAKNDPIARELLLDVADGEAAARKAVQAQKAKLWTACEESATQALRVASYSLALRQQRANCALAAGDFEEAVGDLRYALVVLFLLSFVLIRYSRLTQITAPSTDAYMNIFRISYFYMGSTASNTAMANLKQCLHYDPDSKPCLSAHRLVKSFDKLFKKLDDLMAAEDWRGIVNFILGSAPKDASLSVPGNGFLSTFEAALEPDAAPITSVAIPPPKKASPRRAAILRALCRAQVQLRQARTGEQWCDELLRMAGNEKDIDALLGKGEALLAREEWEEAVRTFERAWEASGGGNREVCLPFSLSLLIDKRADIRELLRFTHGCPRPSAC
jgi:DnaJ family protein C protein 3